MYRTIYSWLLRLYPRDFQTQYGADALDLLDQRVESEKGVVAKLRLIADVLADLVVSIPHEYARVGLDKSSTEPNGVERQVPALCLIDSYKPDRRAFYLGAVVSLVVILSFPFVFASGAFHNPSGGERWWTPNGAGFFSMNAVKSFFGAGKARAAVPDAPHFQTYSVELATGNGPSAITLMPSGDFIADNVTARQLIRWAFQIQDFQLTKDGPEWWDRTRFRVAGMPVGSTFREDLALMLQQVLSDQFRLKLDWRSEKISAFALEADGSQNSYQLHDLAFEGASSVAATPCGMKLTFPDGGSAAQLADFLAVQNGIDRPVIDQTGFRGSFDIHLEWSRAGYQPSNAACRSSAPIGVALHNQLGLHLTPLFTTVGILSVKHLELPVAMPATK